MSDQSECFYCVAENAKNQSYKRLNMVVTSYKGTPLCATHAKKVYEEQYAIVSSAPVSEVHNA